MIAKRNLFSYNAEPYAEVAELVDAPDSKSGDGDIMRVRAPPSVPSFLFWFSMHAFNPSRFTQLDTVVIDRGRFGIF